MKQKISWLALFALPVLHSSAQGGLTIQSGATFKVAGNISIVADNCNIVNNGNGDLATANIYFKGNLPNNFSGTTPLAIQNLYVNKAASSVLLGSNVAIANQVILQSGLLNLNGNDINLSPTGSISLENETNRIIGPAGGSVNITLNLNAPLATEPGNLGAVFTSAENFGSVTIKRSHKQLINGSGKSIFRYYDITPTNNTALATIFRMKYLDAELDGINEGDLRFFKSTNNGISYTDEGFSSRNTTDNFVNLSNVNSFARITLTSPLLSLPVMFGSFNVQCVNNGASISFITLQEINIDKFIIQQSLSNIEWKDIASLNATNSNINHIYNFIDKNVGGNVPYYRIKAIDKNGSITYSNVQKLAACNNKNIEIKLHPVPVKTNATLTVNSIEPSSLSIKIYSTEGKQLLQQKATVVAGINTINLNLAMLSSGSYYLTVLFANGIQQRLTFIK